jgi:hypothetical protein
MAFTRFSNDIGVQEKRLEESVYRGMYALNTPGNGLDNPYIDDIHIRLQRWGGNLQKNTTDLESDLRGMSIRLDRDYTPHLEKKPSFIHYPSRHFSVDETRNSLPAWKYRALETQQTTYLHKDPQAHVHIPFQHHLNTRMLEKDYYNKNKK